MRGAHGSVVVAVPLLDGVKLEVRDTYTAPHSSYFSVCRSG